MPLCQPKVRNAFRHVLVAALCSILACLVSGARRIEPGSRFAQQSADAEKRQKNRALDWIPPLLDSPVPALVSSPPCVLGKVLEKAGAHSQKLVNNLQNFTAQEKIAYQTTDRMDYVKNHGSETFDYVVVFEPSPKGLVIQEKRNPTHGSILSAPVSQDMGLPEMVLIFLPEMQDDYEMRCEGAADWDHQSTWVVRFQQRQDKPKRTFSIRVGNDVHPAGLKGRAWIASDSGEVVHMETGLMEEVPAAKIRHWYLSIDYAPVQFQNQSTRIWLPEAVDGYCDYGDRRTIVYHTFTDFLLFSVQTDQKIEKPRQP